MDRREASADIDQAAADWVARLDGGRLSEDARRDLDVWLAGDVRRRGAFAKANAVLARADLARGAAAQEPVDAGRRRALFYAGGGLAAAAIGGAAIWRGADLLAPMVLRSSKGEVRHVPLADGSSVTLNTDSLLKVSYSSRARRIVLLSGEALFSVAADRRRPFVVQAGDVRVEGAATTFVVRRDADGPVRVLVKAGTVEMTCNGSPRRLTVLANTLATAPAEGTGASTRPVAPAVLDPEDVTRRLAWQNGMIAFNGETLAQAVAEFARYSTIRIVVDDPKLAEEPLAGLYSSSDPEGFAKAVALSFGARATDVDGAVHLSR